MDVRAGIVGISGYTGVELHRILTAHPSARITALAAGSSAGQTLDASWPGLDPSGTVRITEPDPAALAAACDVVFLALPHGVSPALVVPLLDAGVTVIDLGADFRLRDPAVWEHAYGAAHPAPALLEQAVYGLPEVHRDAIRGARLVACPGCYPTATAIAALPLVEDGVADFVISDCLSGVSGAGRKPGSRTLYAEVHESAGAYGVGGTHRHVPEMEQLLGVPVVFTPHLVPMTRGMHATVHVRPKGPLPSTDALRARYRARYVNHPMVSVVDAPPSTREVRGTATARVHPLSDPARGVITITAVIDNLGKGAAGQAVHCMNLALGLDETAGLPTHALLP
jgi:N-acetyl-gamma-glutamyl-phosphate reductase